MVEAVVHIEADDLEVEALVASGEEGLVEVEVVGSGSYCLFFILYLRVGYHNLLILLSFYFQDTPL